jgi:Flp pilus assembly protein TadD
MKGIIPQGKQHKQVCFFSVPESLHSQIGDSFIIDPEIPIPVEIADEAEKPQEDLSWEMIISGMLIVIAEGKEQRERIDYYRQFVLAARPGIMGEFTKAAIVKAQSGDFDLALEILDALRGLFPSSPIVMLNRALVLEEKATLLERHASAGAEAAFQAAEAAYTEALPLGPALPKIFFDAGFFHFGRKDFRRARKYFAQYADVADDKAKKKQAESIIKNIDENGLDDKNFVAAYDLIRQGKDEAGMRSIRSYIEKHPSAWNGWFVLGWALRRMGRWEDGAKAFGKAVELGGSGSDMYNELAICLMETGDLKGARRYLEKALRDDSENVKIISNLGMLALKANNKAEAEAFFRAVLEIDPEDAIANKFFMPQ